MVEKTTVQKSKKTKIEIQTFRTHIEKQQGCKLRNVKIKQEITY